MPFGGHMADVARQGIWASLTGGWYYEPAHSLFCNTLHLYIWTLLLALPLLLGLYANNNNGSEFGIGPALIYLAVLAVLFGVIKSAVSWLHHIFDVVQPIKYNSKRDSTSKYEEKKNIHQHRGRGRYSWSSYTATRATESNALDMIEMLEMHSLPEHNIRSILGNPINEKLEILDDGRLEEEEDKNHGLTREMIAEDEGEQSSSSANSTESSESKCSAQALLEIQQASKTVKRDRGRGNLMRTADSLDLALLNMHYNRMPASEKLQKASYLHHRRKFSAPNTLPLSTTITGSMGRSSINRRRRQKSEERPFVIRRTNSTIASANGGRSTSLVLGNSGSVGVHFPGGILVDELELNRWNWNRLSQKRTKLRRERKSQNQKDQGTNTKIERDQDQREAEEQHEEMDKPCCSSSIIAGNGKQAERRETEKGVSENRGQNAQGQILMTKPPSLLLTDASGLTATTSTTSNDDLKGQITKFLEELIEKHPETLEAIESVRMNRLFQLGTQQRSQSQAQPSQTQMEVEQQKNHHLAVDSTDTSQGAVHAFQDEHGNWFTYCFGTESSGIAQPLISGPVASEIFGGKSKEEEASNGHRKLVRMGMKEGEDGHYHGNGKLVKASVAEDSFSRRAFDPHGQQQGFEESEGTREGAADELPSYGQPTTVNVIHRRRPSSSSSLSSLDISFGARDQEEGGGGGTNGKRTAAIHHQQRTRMPSDRSSSSSDSANRHLSRVPTNVFRAGAGALVNRGIMSMDDATAAEHQFGLQHHRGRQLSESSRQFIAFMQRICQGTPGDAEFGPRGRADIRSRLRAAADPPPPTAGTSSLCPQDRTVSQGSSSVNTVRLLNDLQVNRTIPLPPPILLNLSRPDLNRQRLKYCYHLKLPRWLWWWPFGGKPKLTESTDEGANIKQKELKLKVDRLSLASFFDRNISYASSVLDIALALLVGLLSTLVLSRHIYAELSLLAFSFVIAGAQFSLLKSVQPDAASPVHGFNFMVAYSRPVYFCILSSFVLLLDWAIPSVWPNIVLAWPWRPPWLQLYQNRFFTFSLRDFCSNALLWLPIVFTMGILPQVNTLCMHLVEQLDMHLFGATASFSLLSAIFSLSRSIASVGTLFGLLRVAQNFLPIQIERTAAFSAFVSLGFALAYLLSRESSNPLFTCLIWRAFWNSRHNRRVVRLPAESTQTDQSADSDPSTAQQSSNKLSLDCCFHTNSAIGRSPARKRNRQQKGSEASPNLLDKGEEVEEGHLLCGPSCLRLLVLRTQHNLFGFVLRALLFFGVHCTTVFHSGQPHLERVLCLVCIVVGAINHHVYPQLRSRHPWKLLAHPVLRPFEYFQFETVVEAKLTAFEKVHAWLLSLEKNILYPMLIASLVATTGAHWNIMNDSPHTPLLLTICVFRLLRTAFAQPQKLWIPLLATSLIHSYNIGFIQDNLHSNLLSSNSLLCFFLLTIGWTKLQEFLLKVHFIFCYLAPWQISWGSAFHAFAQPFSVPHSGLTLAQALISSLLSAPLNPFLGSSFFLMSYVRPVKFWERDYNTKRVDHSLLRLASQLDRGPMLDDSNMNAIFYEHLTRSLQKWLAGDLLLGRWACTVSPGDCFILASSYLNCMVQLVEIGNGFVTFQLRGLEFRGTYCHQREMEAISEDWADANGTCCCCAIGRIPGLISFNNAWALRWLAWEVTVPKYVVDGYSISDNSAVSMLQVHELRRLLVTFYVKSIIFYAINSPRFETWLMDENIQKALAPIRQNSRFVDSDPVFCAANDEDYDLNAGGLSRQNFMFFYGEWIEHCLASRNVPLSSLGISPTLDGTGNGNKNQQSPQLQLVNAFCFALSILGRRALGTASYNRHANAAESFLYGMHTIFKGDIRIVHSADEWVFTDPEILTRVISPAVRMALKLHQDHFAAVVDMDDPVELLERLKDYRDQVFISHEHDPAWRKAILANTPSLLALRYLYEDGQDDYKVIMLNKRHLDMRVIKLNRECVRAFWAGQQQELIFLRNKNPERGSIQNARQVLRNMINSSADQPIGYPIYVSPLVTSFVESHPQLAQVLGPTMTFQWCWLALCSLFSSLRTHFGPSSSTSAVHSQQQQSSQSIPLGPLPAHSRQSNLQPPPVPPHQPSAARKEKAGELGSGVGGGEVPPKTGCSSSIDAEPENASSNSKGSSVIAMSSSAGSRYQQQAKAINMDKMKLLAKEIGQQRRQGHRRPSLSQSDLGMDATSAQSVEREIAGKRRISAEDLPKGWTPE